MAKHFQVVVFTVGKEHYGVGIGDVHEIVRIPDVTEVPDAPAFLEGVINLRGRVVPVIDLRKRLHLNSLGRTKSSRILITENSGGVVGLQVDSVSEVRKIQPDSVEEPPEMISAIGIEYITGVAKVEDKLIILLDLKKILSIDEMKKIGTVVESNTVGQAA